MNSKRLKRAALWAGLVGFVWALLTIDPVVRTAPRTAADDGPPEHVNLTG
ncbi:MAG: hypothetical protein AAGN35_17565 [Bacteroidota bacterium]